MAYRERQKISQMTPKGADLELTDLLEVSTVENGSYVTKSITGQEIINAATGGALDLQAVTDNGNSTTNDVYAFTFQTGNGDPGEAKLLEDGSIEGEQLLVYNVNTTYFSKLRNDNTTDTDVVLQFPDKPNGEYTIATTSDIPSLTGYVPYTGATQDVDLGTNKLSTKSVYITGTSGNGHLHLKHQSADATATGQSTSLWADTNGDIKWKNDGDYKTTLKTSDNTADRVYTFRDQTGTVALQEVEFNTQTVNYILDLTDANKLVEMNVGSANTLTIPTNIVAPFPIGTQILIAQYGVGQTTITPAGTVTLRSSAGKTKTAAQYAMATLVKRGTNEWYLAGDITT